MTAISGNIPIRDVGATRIRVRPSTFPDADVQRSGEGLASTIEKTFEEVIHETVDFLWDWANATSLMSALCSILSINYALSFDTKVSAGFLLWGVALGWLSGYFQWQAVLRRTPVFKTFGNYLANLKDVLLTIAGPVTLLYSLTPDSPIDTVVGLVYSSMVLMRLAHRMEVGEQLSLIQRGLSADKNVVLLGLLWSFHGYVATDMLIWLVRLTMLACGVMNLQSFPNARVPPIDGAWFWAIFLSCAALGLSAMA